MLKHAARMTWVNILLVSYNMLYRHYFNLGYLHVGKFRKVSILIVMLFNIQIKAIFRDPRSGTFLLLSELENFYVIQSLLNTSHYRQVKAQHPFFLSPLLRDFIFEFWFCMLKCWNAFLFLFLPLHHSWHSLTLDLGMERNV